MEAMQSITSSRDRLTTPTRLVSFLLCLCLVMQALSASSPPCDLMTFHNFSLFSLPVDGGVDFATARSYCRARGGYLPVLLSEAANVMLVNFMSQQEGFGLDSRPIFLGGAMEAALGSDGTQFRWVAAPPRCPMLGPYFFSSGGCLAGQYCNFLLPNPELLGTVVTMITSSAVQEDVGKWQASSSEVLLSAVVCQFSLWTASASAEMTESKSATNGEMPKLNPGVLPSLAPGFVTYFRQSTCPSGWQLYTPSVGRMVASISNASNAGITVGTPLGDREDRVHDHTWSVSINVPQSNLDNGQNSQSVLQYPRAVIVTGGLNPQPSGFPFAQLLMCVYTGPPKQVTVRSGTIGYFDPALQPSCPLGWGSAGIDGRFLVPHAGEGPMVSNSVPSQASEADVQHSHSATVTFINQNVPVDSCCGGTWVNSGFTETRNITSTNQSNGLPYIQLMTCVALGTNTDGLHQMPRQALVFHNDSCPSTWSAATKYAGRLLVSLPPNGLPGATFGATTLLTPQTRSIRHSHWTAGTVNLLSGNLVSLPYSTVQTFVGYGGSYPFYFTFSEENISMPMTFATMCEASTVTQSLSDKKSSSKSTSAKQWLDPGELPSLAPGFVTYFRQSTCPSGWQVHTPSVGRMVASVSNPSNGGLTVGTPLGDREDRVHDHTWSGTLYANRGSNINVNNPINAVVYTHVEFSANVSGFLPSNTSGFPFAQLLMCVYTGPPKQVTVRSGTIGYFDPALQPSCPLGWGSAGIDGRFLVPHAGEGPMVSNSVPSQASQADVQHSHTGPIEILGTSLNQLYARSDVGPFFIIGGPIASNNANMSSTNQSSGLPYIQLMTCVALGTNTDGLHQMPRQALVFHNDSCPSTWIGARNYSGRLLVSLPPNGLPGATFGATTLLTPQTSSVSHKHNNSTGTVPAPVPYLSYGTNGIPTPGYTMLAPPPTYNVAFSSEAISLPLTFATLCQAGTWTRSFSGEPTTTASSTRQRTASPSVPSATASFTITPSKSKSALSSTPLTTASRSTSRTKTPTRTFSSSVTVSKSPRTDTPAESNSATRSMSPSGTLTLSPAASRSLSGPTRTSSTTPTLTPTSSRTLSGSRSGPSTSATHTNSQSPSPTRTVSITRTPPRTPTSTFDPNSCSMSRGTGSRTLSNTLPTPATSTSRTHSGSGGTVSHSKSETTTHSLSMTASRRDSRSMLSGTPSDSMTMTKPSVSAWLTQSNSSSCSIHSRSPSETISRRTSTATLSRSSSKSSPSLSPSPSITFSPSRSWSILAESPSGTTLSHSHSLPSPTTSLSMTPSCSMSRPASTFSPTAFPSVTPSDSRSFSPSDSMSGSPTHSPSRSCSSSLSSSVSHSISPSLSSSILGSASKFPSPTLSGSSSIMSKSPTVRLSLSGTVPSTSKTLSPSASITPSATTQSMLPSPTASLPTATMESFSATGTSPSDSISRTRNGSTFYSSILSASEVESTTRTGLRASLTLPMAEASPGRNVEVVDLSLAYFSVVAISSDDRRVIHFTFPSTADGAIRSQWLHAAMPGATVPLDYIAYDGSPCTLNSSLPMFPISSCSMPLYPACEVTFTASTNDGVAEVNLRLDFGPAAFAGAAASGSQCAAPTDASVMMAGRVAFSRAPLMAPVFRYAAYGPTSDGDPTWYLLSGQSFRSGAAVVQRNISLSAAPASDGQGPLVLSKSSLHLVHCAVANAAAFKMTFLSGAADLGPHYSLDCVSMAGLAVPTAQATCVANDQCLGFTSLPYTAGNLRTTQVMCLLTAGTGSDAFAGTDRWLYEKVPPEGRTCSVEVADSTGSLNIYVLQSLLGVATVAVSIDGRLATACGGDYPLAGGDSFLGSSSRCNEWALCFAGRVYANQTVSVEAAARMTPGGCGAALGVLFTVDRFDDVSVTAAPEARLPLALYTPSVRQAFPFSASCSTKSHTATPMLYVANVQRLLLSVAQTGFGSLSPMGPAVSVALVDVSRNAAQVLQTCGGSPFPFALNMSGESGQCSVGLYCGAPVAVPSGVVELLDLSVLSPSTVSHDGAIVADGDSYSSVPLSSAGTSGGYSGWVRISAAVGSITAAAPRRCPFFSALLRASATTGPVDGELRGFVLRHSPGIFRTLVAAPSADLAASLLGLSTRQLFPVVGAKTILRSSAFIFNASAVNMTNISASATFACVMDWIPSYAASCIVPIPPGATFVDVLVSQTYMTPTPNVVNLAISSSATSPASLYTCGGAQGFAGQPSQDGACSTYLPCLSAFLYESSAAAQSAPIRSLKLTVPASVGEGGICPFAFAATVQFSPRPIPSIPAGCPYVCLSNRICLELSSICDGIADCGDGADEAMCGTFKRVDVDVTYSLKPSMNITAANLLECRIIAITQRTPLLAFNPSTGTCLTYGDGNAILTNPAQYRKGSPGFDIYVALVGAVTYNLCTSAAACSNNGAAVVNNATGTCVCLCSSGFSGSDCSTKADLTTSGPIAVFIRANTTLTPRDIQITLANAANASTSGVVVKITCSSFQSAGNGQVVTFCEVSGASQTALDALKSAMSSSLVIARVNLELNNSVTSAGISTPPFFQAIQLCDATGSKQEITCAFAGNQTLVALRITLTSSSPVAGFNLLLAPDGRGNSSRRSSGSSAVRCTPQDNTELTVLSNGCFQSVCVLDQSALGASSFSSVRLDQSSATASKDDPCAKPIVVEAKYDIELPRVVAPASVLNTAGDFRAFLFGGLVVVVLAAGMLLAGALMEVRFFLELRRIERHEWTEAEHKPSGLKMLLLRTFRRIGYFTQAGARTEKEKKLEFDGLSVVLATAGFYLAITGVFLVLYYMTAFSYDSNTEVMVEWYRDSQCAASLTAPMPIRASYVPATTSRDCLQVEVTGTPAGSMYFSAYCRADMMVLVQAARSTYDCQSASPLSLPSGSCVPASLMFSGSNVDSSYVSVVCGAQASVRDRFAALQDLNAQPFEDAMLTAEALPPSRAQQWARQEEGSTYTARRLQGGVVRNVTSPEPYRFECAADASSVVGAVTPPRVVFELPSALSVIDAPFYDPDSAAVEALLRESLPIIPPSVMAQAPTDGGYPVGFVYNAFNTSFELTRDEAGPGAARYYGVEGSGVDVGKYFFNEVVDGHGFTISLFLKATRNTEGFAFAVTDAREDVSARTSPLLERIMAMLDNGSPDSAWTSQTYNIYSSLYVDGPGELLRFIYVNPGMSTPLVNLKWDLNANMFLSLLNGLWHHVVIVLRVDGTQTKAQLMVDGLTSTSDGGINQCVPRKPIPIRHIAPGDRLPGLSTGNEHVLEGAVLFTGYFNGGVANLEFFPNFDTTFVPVTYYMWLRSTQAVKDANALVIEKNMALGWLLIGFGVFFFAVLLATSGAEIRSNQVAERDSAHRAAFDTYCDMWKLVPRDASRSPYKTIPFATALRVLKLDGAEFTRLCSSLADATPRPAEKLVAILYCRMQSQSLCSITTAPTAAQWHELLGQHKEQIVEDATLDVGDVAAVVGEARVKQKKCAATNPFVFAPVQSGSFFRRNDGDETFCEGGAEVGTDDEETGDDRCLPPRQGNASTNVQLTQLLFPVISVIQSISVWMSTVKMSSSYSSNFRLIFGILTFDWATALSGVPAIITPIVQFFCWVLIFWLLMYLLQFDEQMFMWNLGRYALRRDWLDTAVGGEKPPHPYHEQILQEIETNPFGHQAEYGKRFEVRVLPPQSSEAAAKLLTPGGEIRTTITDDDGTVFHLERPPLATSVEQLFVAGEDVAKIRSLRLVGYRCPLHGRRLTSMMQTEVYPYQNRPECCIVRAGLRCGCATGMMYACGAAEVNSDGEPTNCSYALCDRHYQAPVAELLIADLLSLRRNIEIFGKRWLATCLLLFLSTNCFVPFVKTAVMILSCNPYYSCDLQCWTNPDQKFILAAYLSCCIIAFYGIGYPVLLTTLLWRRRRMLDQIFFAAEYGNRFGDSVTHEVDGSEWGRFGGTDFSALGTMYTGFEYKWMYIPSIFLLWKAILLFCPTYLNNNSWEQYFGIAITEFCYAVFIFVTEPATSPEEDLMLKLGEVHQLLFLGLQQLSVVRQYHGQTGLTTYMIALTATYLIGCVLFILVCQCKPIVAEVLHQSRTSERDPVAVLLGRMGLPVADNVPLIISPEVVPFHTDLERSIVAANSWRAMRQSFAAPEQSKRPETADGEGVAQEASSDRPSPRLRPRASVISSTMTLKREGRAEASQPHDQASFDVHEVIIEDAEDAESYADGFDSLRRSDSLRSFSSQRAASTTSSKGFERASAPTRRSSEASIAVKPSDLVWMEDIQLHGGRSNHPLATDIELAPHLTSAVTNLPPRQLCIIRTIIARASALLVDGEGDDAISPLAIAISVCQLSVERRGEHSHGVMVLTASPSTAAELHRLVTSLVPQGTESATFRCSSALFTEATSKFADDIRTISRAGDPAIVIGTLRRVADLISRGALQTSVGTVILVEADTMLSTPPGMHHLQKLLLHVDTKSTPLVMLCREETPELQDLRSKWHC